MNLAQRLIFAFVIIIVAAIVCYGVLPRYGLYMPWWVPIAGFLAILAGAVLSGELWEDPHAARTPRLADDSDDDTSDLPQRRDMDDDL